MKRVEVATQADLERLRHDEPEATPVLIGAASFIVWGSAYVVARGSAHVEAWESAHVVARGSAHVEAWESAHVEAWESAHVVARESAHVVAWGSAHVEAWESAHVVARESAHVVAWGSAHVEASQYVAVHQHSDSAVILGGTVIRVRRPTTAIEWCAFYGVPTNGDGVAVLYKTVRDDYRSAHGGRYEPGTTVEAKDWDGGQLECGRGFHFSPHPAMAKDFDADATRFVACPVALEDIRPPQADDMHPSKIKARRVCGPIYEVDRNGKPVAKGAR